MTAESQFVPESKFNKRKTYGFTLIEMLVVMVILSLTTSLLTEGLSTTWRSFERLSARDLMTSSAQLPLSWFEQSLAGAVLYHPDNTIVKGDSQQFEFVTFNSPDDNKHTPQKIIWSIKVHSVQPRLSGLNSDQWVLSFQSANTQQPSVVQSFTSKTYFEYWDGLQWLTAFSPRDARLPVAARIIADGRVWGLASPGRPVLADMPPELARFGEYEF